MAICLLFCAKIICVVDCSCTQTLLNKQNVDELLYTLKSLDIRIKTKTSVQNKVITPMMDENIVIHHSK